MSSQRSRSGAIGRARAYIDGCMFVADLGRRVALKTGSQKFPDPAALAECHRYLAIGHGVPPRV